MLPPAPSLPFDTVPNATSWSSLPGKQIETNRYTRKWCDLGLDHTSDECCWSVCVGSRKSLCEGKIHTEGCGCIHCPSVFKCLTKSRVPFRYTLHTARHQTNSHTSRLRKMLQQRQERGESGGTVIVSTECSIAVALQDQRSSVPARCLTCQVGMSPERIRQGAEHCGPRDTSLRVRCGHNRAP